MIIIVKWVDAESEASVVRVCLCGSELPAAVAYAAGASL